MPEKIYLSAFFQKFKMWSKFRKFVDGGAYALRDIRAGTRLTVHRSLPYRCVDKLCPKSTEFIYTLDLLGDVLVDKTNIT